MKRYLSAYFLRMKNEIFKLIVSLQLKTIGKDKHDIPS